MSVSRTSSPTESLQALFEPLVNDPNNLGAAAGTSTDIVAGTETGTDIVAGTGTDTGSVYDDATDLPLVLFGSNNKSNSSSNRSSPTPDINTNNPPGAPQKRASSSNRARVDSVAGSDDIDIGGANPLYTCLENYPLRDEFQDLSASFLKKYWFVRLSAITASNEKPAISDRFLVDTNTISREILPAINEFLKLHAGVAEETKIHLNDFDNEESWVQDLRTFQDCLKKLIKSTDVSKTLLVEVNGSELGTLMRFFEQCKEVVAQEKERDKAEKLKTEKAEKERIEKEAQTLAKTSTWSTRISSWFSTNTNQTVATASSAINRTVAVVKWSYDGAAYQCERAKTRLETHGPRLIETITVTSSSKKSPAEWEQLTQCLLHVVEMAENDCQKDEDNRKCALAYINKARQIGLFREIQSSPGSFKVDMNIVRLWIEAQHALHKKLGVVQHSYNDNEWKDIFVKAGTLAKTILKQANQEIVRDILPNLAGLSAELRDSVKEKQYSYLQAIKHPDLKSNSAISTKSDESPFSFLFRKTLDFSDKIIENNISQEEKDTLVTALEAALADEELLPMHPDTRLQFQYLCARLREIGELKVTDEHSAEQKEKLRTFLSAFEAFMSGQFCLYRKGQKASDAIKDDYNKWNTLWSSKIIGADSDSEFVQLNEFDSWNEVKLADAWPSELSRRIYRIETVTDYTAGEQLSRKIKIFLILQIIDYFFNTNLCRDKQGNYSTAYKDIIADWQPDKDSTLYDNIFAKLQEDPKNLNIFQIVLAKLIYKLIAPVLERVISEVVLNAHSLITTIASYFPDSEEQKRSKQGGSPKFFRAAVIGKRDEIFERISDSLENIIIVDDEYHNPNNAIKKADSPLKGIKETLKEPRFHKQKKQDQIYYQADRKIVNQLTYTPEWSKRVGKIYDEKIQNTGAKALKIFYRLVRFIAMNALYIPEKLTGFLLRETVFFFYHRSTVSTKKMVETMQSSLSSAETSSHLLNNLFCNLLDQLDNTLTNSLQHIENVVGPEKASINTYVKTSVGSLLEAGSTIINSIVTAKSKDVESEEEEEDGKIEEIAIEENSRSTTLYTKAELTSQGSSLTPAEKKNCDDAISKLLRVIRRYRENFNPPKRIAEDKVSESSAFLDKASTAAFGTKKEQEDLLEKQLKEIALGLGSKLTEALDSILTSDFLVAQFADLQKRLNETLEGTPVTDTRSSVEVNEKIHSVAKKAITLGVKSTCDDSESLSRSHILSYGRALNEIQADTLEAGFDEFDNKNKCSLADCESEDANELLTNIEQRLAGFETLQEGIREFKTKTTTLIENAKKTQIRGVNEEGKYKLDVQLENRKELITKLIEEQERNIRSGLDLQKRYGYLNQAFTGFRAIEEANSAKDFEKILIQSMRIRERRQLYFTRLISSILSLYLPKDGDKISASQFSKLCAALQKVGVFPSQLLFDQEKVKIEVPLFKDAAFKKKYTLDTLHKDDRGLQELETTLTAISQSLFDSLQQVHKQMTLPMLPARLIGGTQRYFSDHAWALFRSNMAIQIESLNQSAERLKETFKAEMVKKISVHSKNLKEQEDKVLTAKAFKQQVEALGPFVITRGFSPWQKGEAKFDENKTSIPGAENKVAKYQTAIKEKINSLRDFMVDKGSFSEYLAQRFVLDPLIQA